MWIERIELAGFGSVVGEKIEFASNKLNLLVEANEFGKSTMATAVWAALFDFPDGHAAGNLHGAQTTHGRESMRPRAGAHLPFQVSLWATVGDRQLKIVRDFAQRSVQVHELRPTQNDVTAEFLGPQGEDEVGFKLTGMTRELFRSTCFVGQRELDEHTIGGAEDFASVFQGIADSSNSKHTAHGAIQCLETALSHYPHRGQRLKIDQVIHELEVEHKELKEKLAALEVERQNLCEGLYKLNQLGDDMGTETGPTEIEVPPETDTATLVLVEELRDLDASIARAKQLEGRILELQAQMDALSPPQPALANLENRVREMWTKRDSLYAEHERLKGEPGGGSTEVDALEAAFQKKWRGLSDFTSQDAQALSLLVMRLSDLGRDLNALSSQKQEEVDRLTSSQVDLVKYESTKNALSGLDPKDAGDVRSYHALMNAAKDQIVECERTVVKHRASILEIEKQRQAMRSKDILIGGGAAAGFVLCAIAAFFFREMLPALLALGLMALAAGVAAGFFILRWMKPEYYKKRDSEKLEAELEKSTALAQQLHSKIGSLEVKLESIARKAGVSGALLLVNLIEEKSQSEPKLKTIDQLGSEIASKESQRERALDELGMFFKKANIPAGEISLERAKRLSDDVAQAVEEGRSIQTATWQQRQMLQQIGTMQGEIEDIERNLTSIFTDNGILEVSLENCFQTFERSIDAHYSSRNMAHQIERLTEDCLGGAAFSDVSTYALHLEQKANDLKIRISTQSSVKLISLQNKDSHSSAERNDLLVKVRVAAKSLDDSYLPVLDRIENVSRELSNARHSKLSLELARNTLRKLSGETYENWSQKLNAIAGEMLGKLDLEFETLQFASDLSLLLKRRGDSDTIDSSMFKERMSVGTREQLHWLARVVISRFLSRDNPLPIILDEPFSESDDERFFTIMQFVVDVLTRDHQVIIFSCHRQRHQWLSEQLSAAQKERLLFCHRVKAEFAAKL
ncbi:MAG: AAA family ATPase [Candidatus Melainabacteria bacterium]|nr:AAA family ATPase [Candidatus Melainabacteria bacterium]